MAKTKSGRAEPKAKSDAYTMMLAITLLAILIGCTLLYLDNDEYGKTPPPKEPVPTLPKLGDAPPRGVEQPTTPVVPKGDGNN